MLLSFLCLIIIFQLYFVPVNVNGTELSFLSTVFLLLSLLFLFFYSFSLVFPSNVDLLSLSCSCFSTIFSSFPVTVNGKDLSLFLSTVCCSCLFCFCLSVVFNLFSCQMFLSFLYLVLIFLLYSVPVTLNGTVLFLLCQHIFDLEEGTIFLFLYILLLYFFVMYFCSAYIVIFCCFYSSFLAWFSSDHIFLFLASITCTLFVVL